MILVTGATGTIGRPLIDLLTIDGVDIRAVTRDPQAADLPVHVEVVEGDPSWPDTIAAFLEGVTALFLHPRAVGDAAVELLALARERGVKRVVTLSAMNVDDGLAEQPSRFRGDKNKEVEDAAVGSGLEWVSLRAAFFAINTLHAWGAQICAGDVVRGPYATFAEEPIHERDLAGVGARALLTDELAGRRLELTGPAVPHARGDGRRHRRRDRQAAALPGDPAGGGQAGHGRARLPRAVRRGLDGQVRQGGRAAGAPHRRGGEDPRPPRAHLRRVGRRPRRRLP
jgi:uncharacterized protein YbjT (DUF2867 family)